MIKVNIDKAKEIHKTKLRASREKVFKNLDAQFMIALEQNDQEKIEEIKILKQQLRDITSTDELNSIEDEENLKNYWPEEILQQPSPYKTNQ